MDCWIIFYLLVDSAGILFHMEVDKLVLNEERTPPFINKFGCLIKIKSQQLMLGHLLLV